MNPEVFVFAKNRDGDQIPQRLKLGVRSSESGQYAVTDAGWALDKVVPTA